MDVTTEHHRHTQTQRHMHTHTHSVCPLAISIRVKMATVHKYYVEQMIQYAGDRGEESSRQSGKRKQPDSGVRPEQICRCQDWCRGNCAFKHLEAKYLEGCRSSVCWAHQKCKRKGYIGPLQHPNLPIKGRRMGKTTTQRLQKHKLPRPHLTATDNCFSKSHHF